MTDLLAAVLDDLAAESERLDGIVAALDADRWQTATPAAGWTIGHQIAHLAWTDEVAVLAAGARDGEAGKAAWDEVVLSAIADVDGFVDAAAAEGAALGPLDLLARWRAARPALRTALAAYPAGEKLPWFGPPMSPASMATARFMETWAHALDVTEALGLPAEPTDRVRHVVHLGVRTRDFAYGVHGLTPPPEPFHVALVAPGGETWTYGPDDAAQRVTGSAYDFALLVTQRRHRADVDLQAHGAQAEQWLGIAQAFAGPPGAGREPRTAIR